MKSPRGSRTVESSGYTDRSLDDEELEQVVGAYEPNPNEQYPNNYSGPF